MSKNTHPIEDFSSIFPGDPAIAALLNHDRAVLEGIKKAGIDLLHLAGAEVPAAAEQLGLSVEELAEYIGILTVPDWQVWQALTPQRSVAV